MVEEEMTEEEMTSDAAAPPGAGPDSPHCTMHAKQRLGPC